MTPFVSDPDFTLHVGDVRDVLPQLPAESVDCALTSPPFYALRDYGVEGQIGLEATPDEWASELVGVFREVRRVLKPTATLWIECGDSYIQGHGGSSTEGNYTMRKAARGDEISSLSCSFCGWLAPSYTTLVEHHKLTPGHKAGDGTSYNRKRGVRNVMPGHKPKDLLGQPWMLAFALRADGWYLRQCIVWHKPNAMPESAKDRCTTAHSYVFLLSKSPRYWFDSEAIAEPAAWERWGDQTVAKDHPETSAASWIKPKGRAELVARGGRTTNGQKPRTDERRGFDNRLERADGLKNPRSVWTIPTEGFAEAHFATWPQALVERIIKAGCPEWVCGTCGKPRERVTEQGELRATQERGRYAYASTAPDDGFNRAGAHTAHRPGMSYERKLLGWSDCGHNNYQPGTVLDPFMGSGTTALVARRLGRKSIGIELNPTYAEMAARRLGQQSLLAEAPA